jgi:Predicted Zn-ribbon RNA-binding protein
MRSLILKCPVCKIYTLQNVCPRCGIKTITPHPPKFSPDDKYIILKSKDAYSEKFKKAPGTGFEPARPVGPADLQSLKKSSSLPP